MRRETKTKEHASMVAVTASTTSLRDSIGPGGSVIVEMRELCRLFVRRHRYSISPGDDWRLPHQLRDVLESTKLEERMSRKGRKESVNVRRTGVGKSMAKPLKFVLGVGICTRVKR